MRTVRANSAGVALEEIPDPLPGMLQTVVDMALGHTRIVCVGACHVPDTVIPSEAIRKKVDLEPFLTGVVAVADIGDAFAQLRHPDKHVKLLVRP